ncbi:MAG: hypothetical protein AAFW60_08350 [Pseudomonadota bacterium]
MLIKMIEGCTRIVGKTQGYLGLPIRDQLVNCRVNGPNTPQMVTAWEPTPDELVRLNAGASIHVGIHGTLPPPMILSVGAVPDDCNPDPKSEGAKA